MKTKTTEELLRDLEIAIKNNTMAKVNYHSENRFDRIRNINLLKREILRRVKWWMFIKS